VRTSSSFIEVLCHAMPPYCGRERDAELLRYRGLHLLRNLLFHLWAYSSPGIKIIMGASTRGRSRVLAAAEVLAVFPKLSRIWATPPPTTI
jgi:hypothetical protein